MARIGVMTERCCLLALVASLRAVRFFMPPPALHVTGISTGRATDSEPQTPDAGKG